MDNEKLRQFTNPQTQYVASVKVGTKGQIVIPKEVRDLIHIKAGDMLLLRADSGLGMAIQPFDITYIKNGKMIASASKDAFIQSFQYLKKPGENQPLNLEEIMIRNESGML